MEADRDVILFIAAEGYGKSLDFDQKTFKRDVHVFYMIRKIIKRFFSKGEINHKLLLNNIIICINVFGIEKVNIITRMICNDDEFGIVKSCLIFLSSYVEEEGDPIHNEIMTDILTDMTQRYNLHPTQES